MEQTTLKYLRVLIPGIIFLLGIYPIYNHYFKDIYDAKSLDTTYVTYLSILLGSIYYQLNIRYFLIKWSGYLIDKNIFTKLVTIHGGNVPDNQKNFIKSDRKYMSIFYRILDNDESLKKKTNNVYFNGIFWTSTADSAILSFIFGLIYYYWLPDVGNAAILSKMFFVISIASLILHVLSVMTHIKLSNDQLNFIAIHKKLDVIKSIDDVLSQMPPVNNEIHSKEDKLPIQNEETLHQLPNSNAKEKPKNSKSDKKGVPKK